MEWLFGGRDGCFAWFYTPTVQDRLREEYRKLQRLGRGIGRDMMREAGQLEGLQRQVQSTARQGRWELARRHAIELHRSRLAFDRLGTQKDNVTRVADKIKQQMHAVTVDEGMVLVTRVMGARLQVMHPERFAKMMQRYEELKSKEEMNEEQLNEFFAAGEEQEQAQVDGRSDDERVALIFAELGIRSAPDVPQHVPVAALVGKAGGSGGGGGGGGRDAIRSLPAAADASETDPSSEEPAAGPRKASRLAEALAVDGTSAAVSGGGGDDTGKQEAADGAVDGLATRLAKLQGAKGRGDGRA